MVENMEIDSLEVRWNKLFSAVENQELVKLGFANLVSKYSEKQRHYHTLSHVENCLKQMDLLSNLVSDKFCIEVSIWFHDVIYDPKRSDNEELSAANAQDFLQSIQLSESQIQKITSLILLTKHPSNPQTDDEKYLIDIDLSILGSSADTYELYETWIREEYAHVPWEKYKEGRKEVLNSFIQTDYLYFSEFFREKYEAQARQNIVRAIRAL